MNETPSTVIEQLRQAIEPSTATFAPAYEEWQATDYPARSPKSVAIVGYSNVNLPFAKFSNADEIWTMNHHFFLQEKMEEGKRDLFHIERLFELHQPEWFTRKEVPNALLYRKWLGEKKPFPIYMLAPTDEFPSGVEFPREILKHDLFKHLWRGEQNEQEYYTSSVCMMIGYAIHLGVKRIEFYGVEALTDTEYADQKPAIEFFIGMAIGRGIDVVLHPTCSLCSAQVYGYEGVPHIVRKRLAELLEHYTKLEAEAQAVKQKETADFNSGKEQAPNKAVDATDFAAMYHGAVVVLQTLQHEHDEYISKQFLEERSFVYQNEQENWKGQANMAKAEAELLLKQKEEAKAQAVWRDYLHKRANMMGYSGAWQVIKKLREECRLMKPEHTLIKMIVE